MTDAKEEPGAWNAERIIQMIAGLMMWGWLMYVDYSRGLELAAMTTQQAGIHIGKYAVAFVLIKGVSMEQIRVLVRAWKGKD